jgi:hypothetical protein
MSYEQTLYSLRPLARDRSSSSSSYKRVNKMSMDWMGYQCTVSKVPLSSYQLSIASTHVRLGMYAYSKSCSVVTAPECSVKSFVIRPSTKCYFKELLFMQVLTYLISHELICDFWCWFHSMDHMVILVDHVTKFNIVTQKWEKGVEATVAISFKLKHGSCSDIQVMSSFEELKCTRKWFPRDHCCGPHW